MSWCPYQPRYRGDISTVFDDRLISVTGFLLKDTGSH